MNLKSKVNTLGIGFLFAIFITVSFTSVYADYPKWQVEISLDKQAYILYERIWLDITLTNSSSDTIRTDGLVLPNNDYSKFTIELRDNSGNVIDYSGWNWSVGSAPGLLLLETGEQDFESFNLLELFRSNKANTSYSLYSLRFPFIPIGEYKVQVHFDGVASNELTFIISEPYGEELEVLRQIEKACKIWTKDNTGESARIYEEIVMKFPLSVFAETCFYLSKMYSPVVREGLKQDNYDLNVIRREMIEHYPNSGYSKGRLAAIINQLDNNSKLNIIDDITEEYPNTRCYKFAKQERDRLLKKMGGEE